MGIAQTGTGKTAAFVLPLLHRIVQDRRAPMPKACRALILSPTRELAAQIADNIRNYGKFSKVSVALIVGGVRPGGQIKALKAGADIVVATPGRLLDHMGTGAISLAESQSVVIDEADQMLDLGFLPAIRKIMGNLPKHRQTALFSATMPVQIRKLAGDFLTAPAEVKVAAAAKPVERIAQSVRHVAKAEKRHVLTEILSDEKVERTVVFTRTKRGADRVCKHLKAANLPAAAIHGDKTQGQRDRALAGFRSGRSSILVATDIAARGIDIDDISHVVNFELPNVPEAYVHRIGRTARAGRTGTAISLCDPSERKLLKDIERLIGNKLPCPDQGASHSAARDADGAHSGEAEPVKRKPASRKRRRKGRQQTRPKNSSHKKPTPLFNEQHPEAPLEGLQRMLAKTGETATKSAA